MNDQKPDLHGCEGKIFEDWSGERHYCERVTMSEALVEDEASDYFMEHWSKIEVMPIFMRYVEEIDGNDPDPALDNVEELPAWIICKEDDEGAVPFWEIQVGE